MRWANRVIYRRLGFYEKARHLLLLSIHILIINSAVGYETEVVCKRADVRQPSMLERLARCSVIEGDLSIAFTRLPRGAKLPCLQEITGSLLLYDIDGLDSLAHLFPNLTVIRGQSLVFNYAIVIKATSFRDIALPSLRLIQQGGIRIENNPMLCHADTVRWVDLLNESPANRRITYSVDVMRNGGPECSTKCSADCPIQSDRRSYCWSNTQCQSFCSPACTARGLACHMHHPNQCCDSECLGGCHGTGPDSCVACLHVRHSGVCVARCPTDTLRYRQRRCVTTEQCLVQIPSLLASSHVFIGPSDPHGNESAAVFASAPLASVPNSYAVHQGSCLAHCPSDHVKDALTGNCVPCDEQCPRKRCPELIVHDLRDLYALAECHSAVAIYMSIQDGEPEFVNRLLEESFARLRTIEQSLRIVRSPALTTLRMLRALESLGTVSENVSHAIVLEISGNDNLRDLWLPQIITHRNPGGLRIHGPGSIRITQNRRLCPDRILGLFESSSTVKLDRPAGALTEAEKDLISLTNGDLAYCNWAMFALNVSDIEASSARVSWPKLPTGKLTYEEEPVLAFLFHRPAPNDMTFSRELDRSVSDEWKMLPVTCDGSVPEIGASRCVVRLEQLDPATRYALYVEIRYPLRRTGALSESAYFTTRSINPSPPRFAWLESVDATTLRLTWTSPSKPGGQIDSYLIWFRPLAWDPADHINPNICHENPDEGLVSEHREQQTGSSRTPVVSKGIGGPDAALDQCQLLSACPPLVEIEKISNYQNYPNPGAFWPATVSLWTVDDEDRALPVTFVDPSQTLVRVNILVGHVGLMIHRIPIRNETETGGSDFVEHVQLLRHLPHFTSVIVEIQACQRSTAAVDATCPPEPPWLQTPSNEQARQFTALELRDWSACEAQLCSPRVTVKGRTNALVTADDIPVESIQSVPVGPGSHRIRWSQPTAPNGVVLHYQLRYRLLPFTEARSRFALAESNSTWTANHSLESNLLHDPSEDTLAPVWLTKCVAVRFPSEPAKLLWQNQTDVMKYRFQRNSQLTRNSPDEIVLVDLSDGLYLMQLRVVSLAGSGRWTPEGAFVVRPYANAPRDFWSGQQVWLFLCGMFLTLVLLIAGFATVIYHARQRYLRLTAWTSTNPDYWTIYEVDAWEMDRSDIDLFRWKYPLGHGSFGTVYRGLVRHLRTPAATLYPNSTNVPVAVKTINNATTLFDRRDFISEACHMKRFQSPHLVRLLGIVSQPVRLSLPSRVQQRLIRLRACLSRVTATVFLRRNPPVSGCHRSSPACHLSKWMETVNTSQLDLTSDSPCASHSPELEGLLRRRGHLLGVFDVAPNSPLVVMELMSEGDLATYLRHLGDRGQGSILPSQAYLWATQIADGMAYLAAKHYVHRDLAARNCLVDERLVVKIGDFGLCRQVYDRNYYQKRGHGRLPIRWMAPESLESAYFTSQSDVWSFGVVLWEIATMASLPFRGLSHDEVIQYVLDGNTLLTNGLPTNCSELFIGLMLHCWAFDPHKRPTFLGLCALLAPRFGDSTFRLASFFYTGEPVVDPKSQVARLDPPAAKLRCVVGDPALDAWTTALHNFSFDATDQSTDGTDAAWPSVNPSAATVSSISQPRLAQCELEDSANASSTSMNDDQSLRLEPPNPETLSDMIRLVLVHTEAEHTARTGCSDSRGTQPPVSGSSKPERGGLLDGRNSLNRSDETQLPCITDPTLPV